ncbi:MAG TPA: hypothetical protein VGL36_35780 [Kribbella sp.]
MGSGQTLPREVEQLLGELLTRVQVPAVRLAYRKHVGGHARIARRRGRTSVLLVDDKFLSADHSVQRFLLAHEVARLALGRPRLPGMRGWASVAIAFTFLAPALAIAPASLFPAAASWILWAGVAAGVLSGVGVLLFTRRQHHAQIFADAYAAEHLGESIVGRGAALMLIDKPTFMPQRVDPAISPVFREGIQWSHQQAGL